jgi:hypothetical protein
MAGSTVSRANPALAVPGWLPRALIARPACRRAKPVAAVSQAGRGQLAQARPAQARAALTR